MPTETDTFELRPVKGRHIPTRPTADPDSRQNRRRQIRSGREGRWPLGLAVCGLAITTTFSCVLLAAHSRAWTFPRPTHAWIVTHRATLQLGLQLLANALALVHVAVLGLLINRATRSHWNSKGASLPAIQFWHGLCTRTVNWSISLKFLVLLIAYILLTATPSAIWAGALAPVGTTISSNASSVAPAYRNTPNLKEWPSEINSQGPVLRSRKGVFSFAVGMQLQGSLLASAASATTVDGSVRQHAKLDNSGFTYVGRSYGVGSSVGLVDDQLTGDDLNAAYSFIEHGYDTSFSCQHNTSSLFELKPAYVPSDFLYEKFVWRAYGYLPNSNDKGPEDSIYVGHGKSAIVAIGVGRDSLSPRRILAITAGKSYKHLDKVQCTAEFRPTSFNVSVSIANRNITVAPLAHVEAFQDGGNLTHIVMRQLELISNDQTNLYVSLVGDSLNSSISNYVIAHNATPAIELKEATLPALENAFEAMVDDMLVAYSSAQLMIENDSSPVTVHLLTYALRPGEVIYIRAIFAVNLLIVMVLLIESGRTRLWRHVPMMDYLDPGALISASQRSADRHERRGHVYEKAVGGGSSRVRLYDGSRLTFDQDDQGDACGDRTPLVR